VVALVSGAERRRSAEEHLDGAADERATDGAVAQSRRASVAADEVSTRQEHGVHLLVHADAARASVAQTPVLRQLSRTV